jgi:flagellar FliL protein
MPEVEQVKTKPSADDIKVDSPLDSTDSKKSGIKSYLIGFLAAQVIFAVAGYFLVVKYIKPDPAFNKAVEEQKAAVETKPKDTAKEIYNIEDVVVNPSGTGGSRYFSASIGVEMDAEKKAEGGKEEGAKTTPMDEKRPQLRDALIGILSAKTIEQLTAVGQKDIIRAEILESFKKILAPKNVYQIYFIDFVLQ